MCFFPGTPVSSTNKTDCHDITEILLKVALNIITLTLFSKFKYKVALQWAYEWNFGLSQIMLEILDWK